MADGIPFVRKLDFQYGRPDRVTPLIRRVVARNPSSFTFYGTGTYILGAPGGGGGLAVIDPGPLDDDHVAALLDAVAGETVSHILITHTHIDHSPAAAPLKAATGAPTYGFGPHGSGAHPQHLRFMEGGDRDFVPDIVIGDGDTVAGDGWTVDVVHTPGHTSNHVCFALREEKALFSGDHVMGWSTSVISPPDGDMAAYLASLHRLLDRDDEIYWPTHGPAITAPRPHVQALIDHRRAREAAVLETLAAGIGRIPDIVDRLYHDVPRNLHPAAGHSVLAHLIDLVARGAVACDGPPTVDADFALADR
ncbi:MAG: MBL fold metallo-hydrolase [Hyphomicrobiales bacterium]|nr:MBL fold metallo-hydrolase [Hyphomicrobiales bacterium]